MATSTSNAKIREQAAGGLDTDQPAVIEEPRLQPAASPVNGLANTLKIARFALQRAGEKKLMQVAASLTFTTVLAIVPLLAVVLALFTAFPLFAEFRMALEGFLTSNLMPPAVSDNVMLYLNQFAAKASGLTAIGSLFLIVTSIMLFMTIDEAFNDIWQVERQRPLRQRMLVYWAIISLGPILTGASLWATSVLARESIGRVSELPAVLSFALSFVPLVITALAFTALFVGVPNRRVLWKDALAGGVGTAVVIEIMRIGFAYYLTRFPSYTVIYGAFATLPIFLLWIYLSWLAILLGATVAAILPALRQRRWAWVHYTGGSFVDAIRVLRMLWDAQSGQTPGRSLRFLCAHLQLHQDELEHVLASLKRLGYVVNTDTGEADHWVLCVDQREATLGPLIDELLLDRRQPGLQEPENQQLLQAIQATLQQPDVRLADLFDPPNALPESR
ncbi:YihY family inner membrane protein [Alcaligenaceae bacterium]|nr:YihY family inner membrane protein [Alcaligenaceae bacterium]